MGCYDVIYGWEKIRTLSSLIQDSRYSKILKIERISRLLLERNFGLKVPMYVNGLFKFKITIYQAVKI